MRNNRARSFVIIMIIIAISALLLRFTIERIIKFNIAQNESNASVTLKQISAALENYANDHNDIYPGSLFVLTQTNPAYLDNDYIGKSPFKGYNYSCPRLEPAGYSCYAGPTRCHLTGNTVYTVTSNGLLISEECEKRE